MPKNTVVVFGVTGLIGVSVAKALTCSYIVKGATRDPSSPTAQSLKTSGIEIVQVDVTNAQSLDNVLSGAYGCFVTTHCDFSNPCADRNEIEQGRMIGEACQRNKIQHIVYSTQTSVVKTIGLNSRHMDAKAEVERAFKQLGLPVSSIIIPLLYENMLEPPLRPKRLGSNCYGIDIPMAHNSVYMISAEDIGPIVANIFLSGQRSLNKTYGVVGDKRVIAEMAAIMSSYCNGIQFQQSHITADQWEADNRFPGVTDYRGMFSYYMRVDQRASVDQTRTMNPNLQQFDQWVSRHVDNIVLSLSFPDTPPQDPWACI